MNKKGSITILFCLVLPVFLLLMMFCIETLHQSLARSYLDSACQAAARSELSHYRRETWEEYGIFLLDDVADGDRAKRLKKNLRENLDDHPMLSMDILSVEVEAINPMTPAILKNQILENVKYIAPIEGTKSLKELLDTAGFSEKFFSAGKKARALERAQDNLEQTTINNRRIKNNDESIKQINKDIRAEKRKDQPRTSQIRYLENQRSEKERDTERCYNHNQRLVFETDSIIRQHNIKEIPPREEVGDFDAKEVLADECARLDKAKDRLEAMTGWCAEPQEVSKIDAVDGKQMEEATNLIESLKGVLNQGRDRFYLGEYVLHYTQSVFDDPLQQEVEYVITGAEHPVPAYLTRLLLTRTAIDGLGYFFLDPLAPPELVSRIIYALVLGGLQGALDIVEMLGLQDRVPLVHLTPGGSNPLERIEVSYEDHQRIDLMLTSEEKKLDRIQTMIQADGYTGVMVSVTVGLRRIFPFFIYSNTILDGDTLMMQRKLRVSY